MQRLFYLSFYRKGRTELGDVTPHNIKQLKKLNSVVFPVSYNDKARNLPFNQTYHVTSHKNSKEEDTFFTGVL